MVTNEHFDRYSKTTPEGFFCSNLVSSFLTSDFTELEAPPPQTFHAPFLIPKIRVERDLFLRDGHVMQVTF